MFLAVFSLDCVPATFTLTLMMNTLADEGIIGDCLYHGCLEAPGIGMHINSYHTSTVAPLVNSSVPHYARFSN